MTESRSSKILPDEPDEDVTRNGQNLPGRNDAIFASQSIEADEGVNRLLENNLPDTLCCGFQDIRGLLAARVA